MPVEESFVYGGRGGRVSSRTTTLNGAYAFAQSATWGALGELVQETYPRCSTGACAGLVPPRVQSYIYDRGDLVSTPGWGSFAYHDNGMLARSTHGNGVVDSIDKDPHQLPRPYNIRIGGASPPAQLGVHGYDGGGNLVQLRPESGAQSFHQLTELPTEIAPAASAILETFFLYDAYGRLRTWNDVTGRSQSYDFDAFGNLVKITDFNGFSPPTSRAFAVSQATNQLNTLVAYDARGNLTRRSLGNIAETYQWDVFDQLAAQNGRSQTHLYTADGERVWTLRYDSASTQTDETFTLRGMANQVLTVYRHQANSATGLNSWTWEEDYLYRGGQLLAKATSKAGPWNQVHFTLDHLGTPRVATGSTGQPLETYHYFPYGEQHGGATASTERIRFTGNERDQNAPGSADDLDYKHARYSSPNLGRFLSPDPQLGSMSDPQSYNRYAYARNNPMNLLDPTGEYVVNCAQDDADCQKNAAAFEAARTRLLTHDDPRVQAAAAAYGKPGDNNGVTVLFRPPGEGENGSTAVSAQGSAEGSMTLEATITVRPGLDEIVLLGTVGHEGSHLLHAQEFVASMRWTLETDMTYDLSKNLTVYDLEMHAFAITHAVHAAWGKGGGISWPCTGCVLGKRDMKAPEVALAISRILVNDTKNYFNATKANPGPRQFSMWK